MSTNIDHQINNCICFLENSDEFWVNDAFTSKLTRIKIQMVSGRAEAEPERKETRSRVSIIFFFTLIFVSL